MLSQRQSLLAGIRSVLPILIGVVPFGLIYGVVAVASGMDETPAILMSSIVFAGASQIAATELWGQGAPLLIVVVTGLVVNLRFIMYSASLATYFQELSHLKRWALSYLLTDQAYAVSVVRFEESPPVQRTPFYLGAAVTLWTTWQASSIVGVLVGLRVPAAWGLEFSVPLMFLALLVPTLRSRNAIVVAAVSAVAAVIFHRLPLHSGLVVAATLALVVGAGLEVRRR
jgi:4-azaleucine resistance transporter AzlC